MSQFQSKPKRQPDIIRVIEKQFSLLGTNTEATKELVNINTLTLAQTLADIRVTLDKHTTTLSTITAKLDQALVILDKIDKKK